MARGSQGSSSSYTGAHVTFVRKAHPLALAALGYVLITLAYTWPLPRHILHGVALRERADP